MRRRKPTDLIFLLSMLIFAILAFIIPNFILTDNSNYVEVSYNGQVKIYEFTGKRQEIQCESESKDGEFFHNTFVIDEDGSVYMEIANCPDKTCIRQGRISKDNQTIVCLPHKLIIRTCLEKPDLDITAQ